jgi:hypothetical protein
MLTENYRLEGRVADVACERERGDQRERQREREQMGTRRMGQHMEWSEGFCVGRNDLAIKRQN